MNDLRSLFIYLVGFVRGIPSPHYYIFFVLNLSRVKFVLVLISKAFSFLGLADYSTRSEFMLMMMTGLIKSTRSLKALLNVIRIYERGSGARLNVSKTEAMWLGAWHSRTDQPFGLTWVLKVKILGLVFGQATEVDNWKPKLQKLENHLNLWKSRSLSFVGKALIINTNWVISQVNKLIWPFLWGCRLETVSCQSCHQPILKGGLGIVNFKVKADALKLASTLSNCNVDFKSFYLFKYFLGARLSSLRPEWSFLRDNPSPSTLLLTPFYSRCIMVLASLLAKTGIISPLLLKNVTPPSLRRNLRHLSFIVIGFLF